MNEILKVIDALIGKAAESFETSLKSYWPVANPDYNSLKEANLTFHLAIAASHEGLLIYPEASSNDINQRIDLLLRGHIAEQNVSILIEAKRLYSAEKAREVVTDYYKIINFRFVNDAALRDSLIQTTINYGVLLTLSTQVDHATWWLDPREYIDDTGSWHELRSILLGETIIKRGFREIKAARDQYIMYAIFKKP
jgi:hypothetical protein